MEDSIIVEGEPFNEEDVLCLLNKCSQLYTRVKYLENELKYLKYKTGTNISETNFSEEAVL